MEVVQSSVLCRLLAPLWLWLRARYEYSLLARVLRGIAAGWSRACSGSGLIRFLTREGVLSRAWKDSGLCRLLMFLINLPTRLLQLLYARFQAVFENSFFAQLAFSAVEQTPIAVAWLMLAVMVIPYEQWNNAYGLMGFVACAVLAVFAGMRKKDYRLDLVAVGPWLVAFAAMVMVSWPLSAYPSQSLRFLFYHVACMLCVLVIVSTVEHRDQLMRLMTWATGALIVMSAAGIFQRIQGIEVNLAYIDEDLNEGMPGRVYAFYENPNAFAEVLLMLIPIAVVLLLCSRGWTGRFVGLLGTVTGCMAMAMTYSRACFIGLAFAAFLFVVLWKRWLIPAAILVGLAGLAMLPDTVFHRILTIFNTSDSSTTSRFPLYRAAGELLQQRPVLGAGLGSDAVRSAIADLNLFHGKDKFVHCHDIYLQVWCETGLVGLLSFVGGIFWTFKQGARAVARATCSPQVRLAIIGGVCGVMGTMVCGIADYPWNYPRVMLIFWFVCAIALAGIRLAARETEIRENNASLADRA